MNRLERMLFGLSTCTGTGWLWHVNGNCPYGEWDRQLLWLTVDCSDWALAWQGYELLYVTFGGTVSALGGSWKPFRPELNILSCNWNRGNRFFVSFIQNEEDVHLPIAQPCLNYWFLSVDPTIVDWIGTQSLSTSWTVGHWTFRQRLYHHFTYQHLLSLNKLLK